MYNRLVYGLSSSPGIFQRHLEQLFSDLPHVGVFLDDIIITGSSTQAHVDNLYKVFERLQAYGLRIRKDKCAFFEESINYLGHVISREGVHTCPDKVRAIVNTPAPSTVSEVRAFVGMIMYYGKFIKNVSTLLTPLYNLLKTGTKFVWSASCQEAFNKVKQVLTSSEVLVHYSGSLPLVLTSDASGVGIGCVISHLTPEGERPVAYASRTLTSAERGYAQIDREALALVYGIRKFHQYLYGRKFILRTDHKPLTYIFGDKVGVPVMAASRLQRWAILLSGYNYEIEYVPSSKNCADALSRLPQGGHDQKQNPEVTYLNFVEDFLPVTNEQVKSATSRDVTLSRVLAYVQSGWPTSCQDEEIKPFLLRRHEMYVDRGCLMWGYRVVVPTILREAVLKQLHVSHMGIVKTKALARSYVWWPNIDADVEALCRQCETCAAEAPAPAHAPPSPWPYSTHVWSRLHVDFLGPFKGKTFLVLIDSSSKWLEIFEMARTTAGAVITELRATFARFGLPRELVSDQGPPFTSNEFKHFLETNGIKQSFSPTYHPASNGAAENAVKLCKRAISKAFRDRTDVDAALQTYLMTYRNSIHSTTGESPAMLLQRRSLRSRLDLLRSESALEKRVGAAQQRQVENAGGTQRHFRPGDAVWARDYTGNDKWVQGTVLGAEGSRRYTLDSGNGRSVLRHVDQIRRRSRLSTVPCPEELNETNERSPGAEDGVARSGQQAEVGEGNAQPSQKEEVTIAETREPNVACVPPPRPSPPPQRRSPLNLRPLPNRIRRLEID
ncbi:uncharacterized protein K02A2.6-like [Cydia pomonella]|uniref:uncharacterized protein K02A2.6-like n=1 Tax=Cydia pomonella TaxID=82600 RepID=UPI002ADDB2D3|nr:uncharacterized protein K02A2.6-like [Cydia pomonella]